MMIIIIAAPIKILAIGKQIWLQNVYIGNNINYDNDSDTSNNGKQDDS